MATALLGGALYAQNEWSNGSGSPNNITANMYRSGNVGIGTTGVPTFKLRVSNGNTMFDFATGNTTGNLYFGGQTDNTQVGMRMYAIQSGLTAGGYIDVKTTATADNTEGLRFRVDNNVAGTERMRICANGKIGINCSNPYSRLHVDGDLFVTGNGGASTIYIGDNNTQPTYGIEYRNPGAGNGVAGMSFWKPYGSTNGSGGQGFQEYILFLNDDGNVGIGVTPDKIDPLYKLSVNGSIRSKEVVVETGWADFVFEPGYKLMPLNELESYVEANNHLPGIPTATDVEQNGVKVGEMESKLLQKIEELTLYVIAQNKKMEEQDMKIRELQQMINPK